MHMNTYMKSSTKVNIENQLPQQVIDFWGILLTFAKNVTWGEKVNIKK